MYEALSLTGLMVIIGISTSFLLYKLVHRNDEKEIVVKPKKVLYKSRRIPLRIMCDEHTVAVLRAKVQAR